MEKKQTTTTIENATSSSTKEGLDGRTVVTQNDTSMNAVCSIKQEDTPLDPTQSSAAINSDILEESSKRPTPVVENGDSEPETKRVKVETVVPTGGESNLVVNADESNKPQQPSSAVVQTDTPKDPSTTTTTTTTTTSSSASPRVPSPSSSSSSQNQDAAKIANAPSSNTSSNSVTDSPGSRAVSDETSSSSSTMVQSPTTQPQHAGVGSSGSESPRQPPPSPPPPLKSTQMSHLKKKYLGELEYMLREFRKLERQLLGAKGNGPGGMEESAGSRERREKLHSFILHLEDTIRQIEVGCRLEAEGKSTVPTDAKQPLADTSSLTKLTKEKEEEENVQKLEEHILANLLPVKVRLKKQLAAQQGATRNPAGMPVTRRGTLQPSSAEKGKGTFAAAAEQRRKQAEAALQRQKELQEAAADEQQQQQQDESQYGKPLSGGGSSLTQKLHGATMGKDRKDERQPATPDSKRKVMYAGMTPGSDQVHSGVSAAAGAHKMIIETPSLLQSKQARPPPPPTAATPHTVVSRTAAAATHAASSKSVPPGSKLSTKRHLDPTLPEEERRRLRKIRRRRKKRRDARRREKERQRKLFQNQQAKAKKKVVMKSMCKKKGPRTVEYICALCSEVYNSSCDLNPWWALASHDCPKCRKTQVPRIDITSPPNAIEYHPALLANADDANGGSSAVSAHANSGAMHLNPSHITDPNHPFAPRMAKHLADSDSESDLSELSDDPLSDGSTYSAGSFDEHPLSPAEQAENENFGKEYDGPILTPDHASRLLVLMAHASTCPGRHKSVKHRDVCNSVKFLMLHARDCPGTTATFDICPFPWCRKVKHLMYHLVACPRPQECAVCSPVGLSHNLEGLIGLNDYRRKKHRERMKAAMAAAAAAAKVKPVAPKGSTYKSKSASYRPPSSHKKVIGGAKASYKHVVHAKPPPKMHPRSGTKIGASARPVVTKPTNGVIVKTLVKPANKSHVTIKSNMLGTKSNGLTKIIGNGLVGPPRKTTLGAASKTATARPAAVATDQAQAASAPKQVVITKPANSKAETNPAGESWSSAGATTENVAVIIDKSAAEAADAVTYTSDPPSLDPPSVGELTSPKPSAADLTLGPPSPSTELGPALMTPPHRQESPPHNDSNTTTAKNPTATTTTSTTTASTTTTSTTTTTTTAE